MLDKPAASLTVAGRKRLELARALATEPSLLLLDEVLAGLNPTEIADMVPTIRAIADRGITIVMIEHVMQAVMSLAQHVYVLAEGRILTEGSPQAVVGDARVIEAYLGHGAAARLPRRERRMSEPLLAISGLAAGYGATEVLRDIDLAVVPGEIVAILGANGAGKSTLNRTISGVLRATRGTIHFAGSAIERETPAEDRRARAYSRAGRALHISGPHG